MTENTENNKAKDETTPNQDSTSPVEKGIPSSSHTSTSAAKSSSTESKAEPSLPPTTRPIPSPSGTQTHSSPANAYHRKSSVLGPVLLTAVVVAALTGGAVWYLQQSTHKKISAFEEQLNVAVYTAKTAQDDSTAMVNQLRDQRRRLSQLEQEVAAQHEANHDLQQAFQNLTDAGSQVALLNDIEHLVSMAQQQLSLGGSVANAIISLETAQARLARADRPSLAALQQTINGDIQKLRAVQLPDIASLSTQLDELNHLLDQAVFIAPELTASTSSPKALTSSDEDLQTTSQATQPNTEEAASSASTEGSWWQRSADWAGDWLQRAWLATRSELTSLVKVQHVEDASALLLSSEQLSQVREQLRARVSAARLALMTHQDSVWDAELSAVETILSRRFDRQSPKTQAALQAVQALKKTAIIAKLPDINNSLVGVEVQLEKLAQNDKGAEYDASEDRSAQTSETINENEVETNQGRATPPSDALVPTPSSESSESTSQEEPQGSQPHPQTEAQGSDPSSQAESQGAESSSEEGPEGVETSSQEESLGVVSSIFTNLRMGGLS